MEFISEKQAMKLNVIYNEDCLATMQRMQNNFIDLTVTSPPYDNLKTYNGFTFDYKNVIHELYRITKDGGIVVWVVSDETKKGSESGSSFEQALYFIKTGFKLHDTMIWHKPDCFNFGSNKCYRSSFEYMFVFCKGKIKTFNLIKDISTKNAGKVCSGARKKNDGSRDQVPSFKVQKYKKRDNVWKISTAKKNFGHPAVFPEELVNGHVITWSNTGDIVYDPFMGSGTTAKSALINKRNFIGSEISKLYCDIAKKRLEGI